MVEEDIFRYMKEFGAFDYEKALDAFLRRQKQNPKAYRGPDKDHRIFPNYYAPVLFKGEKKMGLEMMRYSAYPRQGFPEGLAKDLTTFNARRESLKNKFWEHAFGVHHGIILLTGFTEWVSVKNVVDAGLMSLQNIQSRFMAAAAERKKKVEATGKKVVPTQIELTHPLQRKMELDFLPKPADTLFVAVLFSPNKDDTEHGFAIITDEPEADIAAAGHDRMPVTLTVPAAKKWLAPQGKSVDELLAILSEKVHDHFRVDLPMAA